MTGREEHMVAAAFSEVYEAYLEPVWRYVRTRIPDHHEAQDVTSDVFTRAWRSWPRFDPARGSLGGWLFTIAHRTTADWWRAHRWETPLDPSESEELFTGAVETVGPARGARTPETALLEEDLLHAVSGALATLSDRDREALALRFAADLKVREVAEVLGISEGAAKMTIHRAIRRLRELATAEDALAAFAADAAAEEPVALDTVIEGVLEREHPTMSDADLRGLVLHLAAIHHPPMPPELPRRVEACVGCESTIADHGGGTTMSTSATNDRFAVTGGISGGWAILLGPACLACVTAVVQPLLMAVGLWGAAYWLHNLGLALAPVIAWLVWRNRRVHGRVWPSRLAVGGAALLVVHSLLHLVAPGSLAFGATDWGGWTLLTVGVGGDLVISLALRRRQRRAVRSLDATTV